MDNDFVKRRMAHFEILVLSASAMPEMLICSVPIEEDPAGERRLVLLAAEPLTTPFLEEVLATLLSVAHKKGL
jgi:hypothetical protein